MSASAVIDGSLRDTGRPSRRLEEWRYADEGWLAQAEPDQWQGWEEERLAPGERRELALVAEPGVRRLRFHLGKGARLAMFALNGAEDYARIEVEAVLEEGAHFEFGAVTIGGGSAIREFVTRAVHAHPHASSHQVVRSVHWGRATGNFLGRIEVARGAQKTDAVQDFRAMLLEKGASANTRPELEIFADDVKCAHGAAIGQLDHDAAFYMASRGIEPQTARRLLVQAFIGDGFVAMEDEAARESLLSRALETLEQAQW